MHKIFRHRVLYLSLISLTATLLLCLLAIFWQVQSDLRNDSQQRLRFAVEQLDLKIHYVKTFVDRELQNPPADCSEESLRALQLRMMGFPYVRNVLFARNGVITCSAQHGIVSVPLADSDDDTELFFPEKSYFAPYAPVGVFRHRSLDRMVIGVFGTWHIVNILATLRGHSSLYFVSGNLWMDASGRRYGASPLVAAKGSLLEQSSAKYAYRIVTVVPWFPSWSVIWLYSKGFIVALIALSAVAYRLIFRYLSRYHSPLTEMKISMERGEFIPYLQPLNDCRTGNLKGGEILMRWQHPLRGMIAPMHFIPLAEESGLIMPMTERMLKKVADTFSAQSYLLPEGFHFSLNVTATHLLAPSLADACRYFLAALAGRNVRLVLEITERDKRLLDEDIAHRVRELKQLGLLVAIDDFGTGYSGMSALQTLPLDMLKIDRCFVTKLPEDDTSEYIIRSLVSFSRSLNILTVAEGVESAEQMWHLQQLGIDYLQGYFFSQPLPLADFIASQLSPPLFTSARAGR